MTFDFGSGCVDSGIEKGKQKPDESLVKYLDYESELNGLRGLEMDLWHRHPFVMADYDHPTRCLNQQKGLRSTPQGDSPAACFLYCVSFCWEKAYLVSRHERAYAPEPVATRAAIGNANL